MNIRFVVCCLTLTLLLLLVVSHVSPLHSNTKRRPTRPTTRVKLVNDHVHDNNSHNNYSRKQQQQQFGLEQQQKKLSPSPPVRVNYATLKGELVPVTYKKRPLQAYSCFYGVHFMNCTCTNPALPPSQGCYGPKCLQFDPEAPTPQTLYMNYGCVVRDVNVLDCSQNDAANVFFFSNCTTVAGGSKYVNVSMAVDLYDYEFRFDSIELDTEHKVVKCPLERPPPPAAADDRTFLHGYHVHVRGHVHKIPVGFREFEYVTQILECKTRKVVTQPTPLALGATFQQFVEIELV